MEENPALHPGVPTGTYHTLGRKTFFVFVLDRIQGSAVFLLVAAGLFLLKDEPFLRATPVGNIGSYVGMAAWIALGVFIVVFLVILLISWLIYITYRYYLGDDALKVKRGILTKEEVAIPYRQIQDVDITRDLGFQMLGLSRIVILTAGSDAGEDAKSGKDASEGILPALDKDLAEWLQAELLRRANVQKVVEVK